MYAVKITEFYKSQKQKSVSVQIKCFRRYALDLSMYNRRNHIAETKGGGYTEITLLLTSEATHLFTRRSSNVNLTSRFIIAEKLDGKYFVTDILI